MNLTILSRAVKPRANRTVLIVASVAGWWLFFECLPQLTARLGLIPFVLLAPLLAIIAIAIYTPLALGAAVLAKRLLIGRYTPLRR